MFVQAESMIKKRKENYERPVLSKHKKRDLHDLEENNRVTTPYKTIAVGIPPIKEQLSPFLLPIDSLISIFLSSPTYFGKIILIKIIWAYINIFFHSIKLAGKWTLLTGIWQNLAKSWNKLPL